MVALPRWSLAPIMPKTMAHWQWCRTPSLDVHWAVLCPTPWHLSQRISGKEKKRNRGLAFVYRKSASLMPWRQLVPQVFIVPSCLLLRVSSSILSSLLHLISLRLSVALLHLPSISSLLARSLILISFSSFILLLLLFLPLNFLLLFAHLVPPRTVITISRHTCEYLNTCDS